MNTIEKEKEIQNNMEEMQSKIEKEIENNRGKERENKDEIERENNASENENRDDNIVNNENNNENGNEQINEPINEPINDTLTTKNNDTINILTIKIKSLEQNIKIKDNEIVRLKNSNKNLNETNNKFINNMKKLDSEKVELNNIDIVNLQTEMDTLKTEFIVKENDYIKQIEILKIEVSDLTRSKSQTALNQSDSLSALQAENYKLKSHSDNSNKNNITELKLRDKTNTPFSSQFIDTLQAEIVSLKASLTAEQNAREAALLAWENCERKLMAAYAQSGTKDDSDAGNHIRVLKEEKRAVERTLEWTTEQLRRSENRLHLLETEHREKSEEITQLRVQLGCMTNNTKNQVDMEQIKTQVLIESLQAEMEYRQKLYTHQIASLTESLQSTTLEKLSIEKQMLLNEANFHDMLSHREQQLQAHYAQSIQYRQQMERMEPPQQLPPSNNQFNRRTKQVEMENLDRQIENVKKQKPTSIIDELEPLAAKMAKLTSPNHKPINSQYNNNRVSGASPLKNYNISSIDDHLDQFDREFWGPPQKIDLKPLPSSKVSKAKVIKPSPMKAPANGGVMNSKPIAAGKLAPPKKYT